MLAKKDRTLKARIQNIKNKLQTLGQIRPGSLSLQYNVCGRPTCRCKDQKNPKKHGPYYKLSYCWRGKNKTIFVKKNEVSTVTQQIQNYKVFRNLVNQWVDLSLEQTLIKKMSESSKILKG